MTEHKLLDAAADVLPVGLQPTPFGEVWQALQQVAAQVWDVDPSVYRAGIAWMWYALRNPEALASDGLRPLLVAALISEQAPLVKDTQTVAELAEYLRLWRDYTPTYPKLEALYSVFAARVEVRPILDAESQGVVPVTDRRLAFYLRVEEFDAARPLTLEEVYQIAVRATPLGSRPVPYYALTGGSDVFAGPASAGLVRALWASEPAEPVTPPTPSYTEITLYMQSGSKRCQLSVSSSFTGNVDSERVYQLYTDEECTTPWIGYDYSNDYEVGRYVGGEWNRYTDSVSAMPSSTAIYGIGYILMDTGALWLCCNSRSSTSVTITNIVVRIYPKDQSLNYHVGYFYSSDAYGNRSGNLTLWPIYTAPGTSTLMTYFGNTTIVGLYGSAGNPVALTADDILTYYQQDSTWRTFRFKPTPQRTMVIRSIVFTTPKPMEIDIDVNFGDPVTIPAEYHVESVKCQRLYVNASSVTHSIYDQHVSFVFDGENQYCSLNDTTLLGAGVVPCLTIFAIASDQGGGYWITYRPMSSTVNPTVSLSNKRLNSGGAFVSADALVSGATSNADTIANALNTYPALFRYYDSSNVIVPYFFKIQQSLWQFQNGMFSWLGDTTDVSDLAYWYNTRAVRVHCVKI